MELKVGADPELFLLDERGKFHSAYGMIEGTKDNPYPVPNGAVQVDGMALEINPFPSTTSESFTENIEEVMKSLREAIPPEFSFSQSPTARFDPGYFNSQPDEAKALGCDPDFDAYSTF